MTAATAPGRGAALAELAGRETRLLAGTATPWLVAAFTAALCRYWYRTDTRHWDAFTADAGLASLILAGVLLLLGHLAASRDDRHGAAEAASVLPTSPRRRTLAMLALVPAAGLIAAGALGAELLLASTRWPAGRLSAWQLLTPVAVPMLGAAVGVATGRWLPFASAGPLVLFAFTAALALLPVFATGPGSLAWAIFPVTLDYPGGQTAAAGWHAIYLLALLAMALAAGTLRHWRAASAVALVIAAAVVVLAVGRLHASLPAAVAGFA